MKCAYCGREIFHGDPVQEDEYLFCNTICRYQWRSGGKKTPFQTIQGAAKYPEMGENELEYLIDAPGFENRGMMVRLSYWAGPQLFLDGKKLAPRKFGFMKKKREYHVQSNFGKEVVIRFRRQVMDHIPVLEIDGTPFPLARPLTLVEKIWTALPFILFIVAGAIGGVIGGGAIFSNSILMRKMKHWFPRYLTTGVTTVVAAGMALQLSAMVTTGLADHIDVVFEGELMNESTATNLSLPRMIDRETQLTSMAAEPGKRLIYFYTLVNYSGDSVQLVPMKDAWKQRIIANIKSAEELKRYREHEVTFVYRYKNKRGDEVLQIVVKPEEYLQRGI